MAKNAIKRINGAIKRKEKSTLKRKVNYKLMFGKRGITCIDQ